MTTQSWSLASVWDGTRECSAALLHDSSLRRIDVIPSGLTPIDVVRQWAKFSPLLQGWSIDGAEPLSGCTLLAPLRYPSKVICVGANYRDHRREMATAAGSGTAAEPFFLLKPPTTTIIGPGETIYIRGDEDRVDWEGEVGVVIGKRGRFIDREATLDHIAGYTLVNDVSARGAHGRDNPIHAAFAFDWVASKGQDGFCPMGPGIVPAWLIPDPDAIPFSLAVNGVTEQSGSTANLIADIRTLVSSLSKLMTLEEGDVIATGTPAGVGMAQGRFLVPGDEVSLTSPLIGTFSNTIARLAVRATPSTMASQAARA